MSYLIENNKNFDCVFFFTPALWSVGPHTAEGETLKRHQSKKKISTEQSVQKEEQCVFLDIIRVVYHANTLQQRVYRSLNTILL